MTQSFWTTEEYQGFLQYTEKLEREHTKMSEMDLKRAVANWQRGVDKMRQLAIGYDVNYEAPTPSFLGYSQKDSIHWIKLNKLDGFTIGLWDGENRTIDGKPVFHPDYLDIESSRAHDFTEMEFDEAKMAFFEVMQKFDGVVVPDVVPF